MADKKIKELEKMIQHAEKKIEEGYEETVEESLMLCSLKAELESLNSI